MRKKARVVFLTAIFSLLWPPLSRAAGVGSSAGLTLIEPASARAASLGEAFVARSNDISAFAYNPASLNSLKDSQLSFSYQKRFDDESFGQLLLGTPLKKGALGFSVSYFDAGKLELIDGQTSRTVTAQRDLAVSLGYSIQHKSVSYGVTGKFISSELGETVSGSAVAMDAGIQRLLHPRLRFGAAIQNIGTDLKYINEKETLPRIARVGLSWTAVPNKFPMGLLLEVPYFINEEKFSTSLGLEVLVNLLHVRAGYQIGNGLEGLSVGTGFLINQFSVDYAFGFANELDSQQHLSVSLKFGGPSNLPEFVKKQNPKGSNHSMESKEVSVTEISESEIQFLHTPEETIHVSE